MLTVKQAAEVLGANAISVRIWASRGRFPGAEKQETPVGSYWLIPADALKGFEMGKAGRPAKPGSKRSKAAKSN